MTEYTNDNSILLNKIEKLQNDFVELNKVFELTKIVNQSNDLCTLTDHLINYLQQSINSENIAIFVEKQDSYKVISSYNINKDSFYQFKNENEGIWKILQQGETLKFKPKECENIYHDFFNKYELNGLNPSYWIPLIQEDKVIAIISIKIQSDNKNSEEDNLQFFSRVVSYISPVINKFKTQKEKEEGLVNLQKTLHNISILYNIGQAINFIDDLKGLLKVILDKALKTIEAEKGSLMLYDYTNDELVVKVVYGLQDKELEEKINDGLIECSKIKSGEGIAGKVLKTKTAIITNLGMDDPRFVQSCNSYVSSILCVPLIVKGDAIGVINITNKLNDKLFNQHDLDFMEALANQAAIAIDNAQLYELATKDGLTKLYIYRYFYSLLESEIKRSARYVHKMSLVMMDIDNFKSINDTYGHPVGDQVLKEVANTITNTCRKVDLPCRYGGEEFALILPETCLENAKIIAERLRQNIENINIFTKNNEAVTITISIGISEYPTIKTDSCALIEAADKALYFAKNSGKNCVAIHNGNKCEVISCSIKGNYV